MKSSKIQIYCIITLVGVLTLSSCDKNSPSTSGLYTPSESDVTTTATLEDLQAGRELYINNCGECHSLYLPEDLSKSQWNSSMNKMAPYTSLTNSEIELVTKYVTKGE